MSQAHLNVARGKDQLKPNHTKKLSNSSSRQSLEPATQVAMVDEELIIAQYLAKKRAKESATFAIELSNAAGKKDAPVTIILDGDGRSEARKSSKKPKKMLTIDLQMN